MNDTPDPRIPPAEDQLGQALGDALRSDTDDLVIPPPVANIADRAAAKARARTTRRTVGSIAASVALVAGGLVAVNATGNDGEVEQAVAVDNAEDPPASDTAATPPDDATGAESATSALVDEQPAPAPDLDPADISTGPTLDWVQIEGPGDQSGSLMATSDGRIVARLWSETGTDAVMVTSDGRTWEPVPAPPGVSPGQIDLGSELWVMTAFDQSDPEPDETVYASEDQGATWRRLDVPGVGEVSDGFVVTRTYVSGAVAFGDAVVVATSSWTDLDVPRIAIDMGIADSEEQVLGWGTSGGDDGIDTISIDIGEWSEADELGADGPSDLQTFEFTAEELGLGAEALSSIHDAERETFSVSVVGLDGVRSSQEFAGSPSRLTHVDGTLVVSSWTTDGSVVLSSTDGRTWTRTPAAEGFEVAGAVDGTIVGTDWAGRGFVVDRLTAGGLEQVAAFPELSPDSMLAAGPAGLAGTVHVSGGDQVVGPTPDLDPGDAPTAADMVSESGVLASRDGIELRITEDGGGVLIDTTSDEVLRSFTPDEMEADEAPVGVTEIEEPEFWLRIDDPVTGEELVTFRMEDFESFFTGSPEVGSETVTELADGDDFFEYETYSAPATWVGWSADGTTWGFQTLGDAFGVPDDHDAWAQLAVGDGFVVAVVEQYAVATTAAQDEAVVGPGEAPVTRWFIARTG